MPGQTQAQQGTAGCSTILFFAALFAATSIAFTLYGAHILRALKQEHGAIPMVALVAALVLGVSWVLALGLSPSGSGGSMKLAVALGIGAAIDVGAIVAAPRFVEGAPSQGEWARAFAKELREPAVVAQASADAGTAQPLSAPPVATAVVDAGDAVEVDPYAEDPLGTMYVWRDASGSHVTNTVPPPGAVLVSKTRPRADSGDDPAPAPAPPPAPSQTSPTSTATPTPPSAPATSTPSTSTPAKPKSEPSYSQLDDLMKKAKRGGMAPAVSGVSGNGDMARLTNFLMDNVDLRLVNAACKGCGAGDLEVRGGPGAPGNVSVYLIVDADEAKSASAVASEFARANNVSPRRVIAVVPGRASLAGTRLKLDQRGNLTQ